VKFSVWYDSTNITQRKWSEGRFVTNFKATENDWITRSSLAVNGRPSDVCVLPSQAELVLPESTDPSKDLKMNSRARPSPGQVLAQKGTNFAQSILTASLAGMNFAAKEVVLVRGLRR
jgi:hypothetical protein